MTTPQVPNAEDAPLSGVALTIWKEVVCGGEHLVVCRGEQRLAVILPVEDYETMIARANGSGGDGD